MENRRKEYSEKESGMRDARERGVGYKDLRSPSALLPWIPSPSPSLVSPGTCRVRFSRHLRWLHLPDSP